MAAVGKLWALIEGFVTLYARGNPPRSLRGVPAQHPYLCVQPAAAAAAAAAAAEPLQPPAMAAQQQQPADPGSTQPRLRVSPRPQ